MSVVPITVSSADRFQDLVMLPTSLRTIRERGAKLLNCDLPDLPTSDIPEEARFFAVVTFESSRLAHQICEDITDLRAAPGRRIEEWEVAVVNRLLVVFQVEWKAWRVSFFGRRSSEFSKLTLLLR